MESHTGVSCNDSSIRYNVRDGGTGVNVSIELSVILKRCQEYNKLTSRFSRSIYCNFNRMCICSVLWWLRTNCNQQGETLSYSNCFCK